MIQPRPYQSEAIQKVRVALRSHRRVLLQLPTGGGKTVIACVMTKNAVAKGLRVWFICHRDFLIEQTSQSFYKVDIEHSFIASGRMYNPFAAVQICSIDTLKNRLDRVPFGMEPHLVIWDECHHLGAGGWSRVFKWAEAARHVGLSATPCRLDGRGLDDKFDALVPGPSVDWLIQHGYLSKYRAFAPTTPDTSGLHMRAGDWADEDIAAIMSDSKVIGDMVRHYREKASGLRAVYFAPTIALSQRWASEFVAAGIRAVHLDGSSSSHERTMSARAMAIGELDVIFNVALFGEGYDLAAQAGMDVTIEAVGLGRPTQSLALHLQQIGRALRPKPSPAIVLDHAGNLMRHGMPCDDREWTLEGSGKKKKGGDEKEMTRNCDNCLSTISIFKKQCPVCGHIIRSKGGRNIEEEDGELNEIDVSLVRRRRKAEESSCETIDDFVTLAVRRQYQHPERWAAHMFTHKMKRERAIVASLEQSYLAGRH